ncbi:DNA cytosine methyltransferase [Shewanella frigidimarina]|nr:DNA cytosine methyltransferase [Shewanella vesiculosa]NCQ44447.1 DNA cytosine methyltransferase [Shewanella frigidimarina]PJB93101.1 MAG: DNA (cytosine-5-)-methyltransferase [Shewanella sp. CG_4_9_14_0_8_um_filter_42_14]NCP73454.1 DNA cytosine methyltransferase [Shewanella vesiculosa]NCP92493.1 DNA cytosine methyltransferase [Shewanella vesiculosa]
MENAVIDLFCGTGGLTHGLLQSGLNVIAGFDIEKKCEYSYVANNHPAKFFASDVSQVTAEKLNSLFGNAQVKILAGCAPCQPFSTYTQAKDKKTDKKWPLMYEFSRLIRECRPEIITMENVPDVIKHSVYTDFVSELEGLGYFVSAQKVPCKSYGIPQDRIRHVLLASLFGPIELIEPTHKEPVTVRQVIGDLPKLKAGGQDLQDKLHKASKLSDLNMRRIQHSKQGGTWKDWPENLLAECHKKNSGKGYSSVYGRMLWDQPSPTMTTLCYGFGNGRFGHPEQDRGISLREAAILQSFPKNYSFVAGNENPSMKHVGKLIGNAVPVRLGEVIGLSINRHISRYSTV